CAAVMLFAHDRGVQDPAGGIERINRRIDAQLGDLPAQYRGCIQVSEGGGGCRIGKVIRRHVHGLYRGDGTTLGGGDALLHGTHFGGQRGLITNSARHTSQKGRYFRSSLGETEDVVHEEENVAAAALLIAIAEIFGERKSAQRNTGTRSGGLVHLPEDEGGLAGLQCLVIHLAQVPAAFFHAVQELLAVLHNAA